MLPEYLAIGEIVRPQGIRGELKVRPFTDDPQRFFDLSTVRVGEGSEKQIHCLRVQAGYAFVRIQDVYSRETAEELRGTLLYVRRADAVSLPSDSEFICDLIGCEATDTDGVTHGRLIDVLQTGGVDVYTFRSEAGDLMVPALKQTVLQVDVQNKRMILSAERLRETAVRA
ncbi:MAG: ribosome maturation factor RimM [Clostridia bacterium]|nr:ribosome maturation factor RimM [Clostridia bacterium]